MSSSSSSSSKNKNYPQQPPPPPPTLEHVIRCQETLTRYIAHYIQHNRASTPISYLIVCAGHPDPKILVTICNKERFLSPSGKLFAQKETVDPITGEELAAKHTAGGRQVWDDSEMRFNGVGYKIVVKEGPVEAERWMDEEGFVGLFDAQGNAKADVMFFDLVEFEEMEEARLKGLEGACEERKLSATEAEEAEKDRERKAKKNKDKRQKQKVKKAAAKAGVEVAAAEEGGAAEVPDVQTSDAGEARSAERAPTWAEKAAFNSIQKS